MTSFPSLNWLPALEGWKEQCKSFGSGEGGVEVAVNLANTQLDFVKTNMLDTYVQRRFSEAPPGLSTPPVRLAILGSSTLSHLHPAIRIAGLRRSIWIDTYENSYGQYMQELLDRDSSLHAFKPTAVLFALDSHHLTKGVNADLDVTAITHELDATLSQIRQAWKLARQSFGSTILQQTALPIFPSTLGSNEHRFSGSRARAIRVLNDRIRESADVDGVDIVAIDDRIAIDGLMAWHDPPLWHRSKQEITPLAAPMWGDLVGRVVAAQRGRSFKALVLDLDNTLWGGVIGDDGLDGIVLGQGSPLGEGFVAVQSYAKELSRRGIILAVASKNDMVNAIEPFEGHPEMILRKSDIASFRADWNDKAGNIRAIAQELNIGLDSLVFLDDNPFERSLVRKELPMVAVPEVPDDPGLVPYVIAAAGYFESVAVTGDDLERTQQYQSNREREQLRATATDLEDYLRDLQMRLLWSPFDSLGLQRTVQLINKTNQFNLTTRRYSEEEVLSVMKDRSAIGLQLRLVDRFGDNGIVGIIIGRLRNAKRDLEIDTWLMSCRVLGRQVEATTLNLLAEQAKLLGATRLVGEFIPTKKNGMVKDHYERLGFSVFECEPDGKSKAALSLDAFEPRGTFIQVERAE